ncbi:MAG TPA: sterol desaturase family protein [Acidimicrobiales bacterium]|nr:sterol desaturase family protein [Acidimicrobiales bacterium]
MAAGPGGWAVTSVLVALAAFTAMEPVTYAAHRWVMHGPGARFHRSHHRRWPARREGDPWVEGNDVFPVLFAGITVCALALGFHVGELSALVPVSVGVTAYGAAYALVHDVYVHRRLAVRWSSRTLDRLADAHELHHRFGGEPYGMLVPVVPHAVRRRAERAQVQRPSASTPRRQSTVASMVRSRNDSPPSSSANRWSRSPYTESSG